ALDLDAKAFKKAGATAPSLRVVREMGRLLERRDDAGDETFYVVKSLDDKAKTLWTDALAKKLTGDEVRDAVDTLLGVAKPEQKQDANADATPPWTPSRNPARAIPRRLLHPQSSRNRSRNPSRSVPRKHRRVATSWLKHVRQGWPKTWPV